MTPTKDAIKAWLKRFGRSREWLGEQCGGINKRTVDNWLSSPQEIPESTLHLISRLMADDERSEKLRAQDEQPQSHLVVRVEVDEFHRWEQAALHRDPPMTVTDYAVMAIRALKRR